MKTNVIIIDKNLSCYNKVGTYISKATILKTKEIVSLIKVDNEDWLLRNNQFRKVIWS